MSNREYITPRQFREWERVFAPYKKAVEKFAKEKYLRIEKRWNYEFPTPTWHIGKDQRTEDLNIIWRDIQLIYDENEKKFSLHALAWLDREYQIPEGKIRERRLVPINKTLIATWKADEKKIWIFSFERVNIKNLLKKAYKVMNSFTEQDLTWISTFISEGTKSGEIITKRISMGN